LYPFLIGITSLLEGFIDFELVKHLGLLPNLEDMHEGGIGSIMSIEMVILDWTIINLFVHGFYFLLSFGFIFLINNVKKQDVQSTLEQEKLNTELKFLKAQINPHFLFNGINSIYHLIDQKPEIAKSTLLNFSNLLRYQLYECNDDLIPLEKELNHIRDYVMMEKIRKGEDVQIELELPIETHRIKIPPLLFTPFIENAFKYVSNYDDGTKNKITIKIRLYLEQGKLWFESENTIDKQLKKSNGGIGISNVEKRLTLLFPDKHDLTISKMEEHFIVGMSLDLPNNQNNY